MTRSSTIAPRAIQLVVGWVTVLASALYLGTDVLEVVHGGFTSVQLVMTFAAEAAIPLFVLGLLFVQFPSIAPMGAIGAVSYAYAFTYFSGTVLVALVLGTKDWATLSSRLEPWVTVHGVVMMVGGTLFGLAVARAGVLPQWTGWCLVAGVLAVGAASALPAPVQLLAAAVRDLAFAAMGASLVFGRAVRLPRHADLTIRELEGAIHRATTAERS